MGNADKVIIAMISMVDKLHPAVERFVASTGMEMFRFVAPRVPGLHSDPEKNRCVNIANARNVVREEVLKRDAAYYFWLDDDVVPSRGAVHHLVSHKKPAVGGWFQMRSGSAWVGGRWVADHVFQHFFKPEKSLVKTDLLSLGCALVRRDVLQAVSFDPGIDRVCTVANGTTCHLADSGDFSDKLLGMGIQPYLDGSVVCRHLEREQTST